MKDLLIVGAGGFGRELLQWCKDINAVEPRWNIKGFLDDNLQALGDAECDIKVIGTIKDWVPDKNEEFALGIAEPHIKEKVVSVIESKGGHFASVIHPEARIGEFNKLGKGVVIYPGARVTVNATIGDYATILDLTAIGHDAKVGNYTTICGGCGINGHVEVGSYVFIGSHITTAPSRKIGDGAYVGTGSVVITNVKPDTRVFGNPAKKVMM